MAGSTSSPFDRTRGAPAAPDRRTNPRALKAHLDRRPYWIVRFADREDVFEGDPCPCRRHDITDWGCMPRGRQTAIMLMRPDGRVSTIESAWADMTGKLFQLKQGVRSASFGGTGYHLIGAIAGLDGQCLCYAWEYDEFSALGGHIVGPFRDNVYRLEYGQLGPLALANLGLRL